MHLSKLEIIGFKSFADKTTLTFNSGLSSIVGPNGSGKTNFVDALRWVLGEQKTSVLRSESMDNVIFNGSKNRKPLGLAEVSITIQNTRKMLPTEFDEINITRRLFRDGESQYLINKVPARLKDIVSLFMDSGLGTDSYSVIELKMIEDILSGNPSDRRSIFEEAAGIKKYKLNKKEATKKLQDVVLDIERLNDITSEVQKNVASLSRQASKTKRYNSLIAELKNMEIMLFSFELITFKNKILEKRDWENNQKQKILVSETEIKENESFLLNLKNEYNKFDEEYQKITKIELDINNQLSNLNNSIALNQEKIKSIDDTQKSINREIDDSSDFLQRNENNLERLTKEINDLTNKKGSLNQELEDILIIGKEISANFKSKEPAVLNLQSSINELKSKINYNNSIIQRNLQNKEKIIRKIQEEKRLQTSLNPQIEEQENIVVTKKIKLDEQIGNLNNATELLKDLVTKKSEFEKQMEVIRNEEFELKALLQKSISEKNFLESIVINDETSKFLLKNKDWNKSNEKILFGEVINVDDKYKKALNMAIDEAISSFIINDFQVAKEAIHILNSSKQGSAHFLLNKDNSEQIAPTLNLQNENGVLGYLSDFVETKQEFKNILNKLTNRILLVENFEIAKRIYTDKDLISDGIEKIVTLNGEVITPNGIIRGGGESAFSKAQIIGRRNKIQKLSADIDKFKFQIEQKQLAFKELQTGIWQFDIPDKENKIKILEKEINSLEREIAQTQLKIQSLQNNQNSITSNITQLDIELQDLDKEIANSQNEIDILNEQLAEIQGKYAIEKSKLEGLRADVDKWNNTSKQKEIEIVQLQSELKFKENELQKVKNSIENNKKRINDKRIESQNNSVIKQHLIEKVEQDIKTKEKIIEEVENIKNQKEQTYHKRKNTQEQVNQYELTIENLRKVNQNLNNELHNLEIEIASLATKIEGIDELARGQYDLEIEEYIRTNQISDENFKEFDPNSYRKDIALTKEKISALGNVNFQALEDYEEQKQRLDFLLTQLNDLTNSQAVLNETIAEINKVAIEKFLKTFEQIRTNFNEMFKTLFGQEGEADLKLEGDSPLEASVYITAKPPFKKPSSIDSLSAGEKTLTAIALLFAIYLVKPSPFCVLDEVDGPLDDNNIDRFVSLVRKFSEERDIQFILITHNKKTMEAADTLYGITMEEEGVSKIVSVKLEK
jgi:chromosome segregation protein